MKTLLLSLTAAVLLSTTHLYSQQNSSLSKVIDSVFMNLSTDDISTGVLYNKCFGLGKPNRYGMVNDTVITKENLKQLLLEMKSCSIDTNNDITTLDSLRKMLNEDWLNGFTPILFLDFKFNQLKDYALDSNLVYLSDNQLYDNEERNESPYTSNEVFIACPGFAANMDSTAKFYLNPNYFFTNSQDALTSIEIDFGDGQDFRTVEIGDTIEIHYQTDSLNLIKIRVHYGEKIGYSESNFKLTYDDWEDDIFNIRGNIEGAEYTINYAPGHTCIEKPFLFVEGIDFGYEDYPIGCRHGKCGNLGWVDVSTGLEHIPGVTGGAVEAELWPNDIFDYAPEFFSQLYALGYDVIYLDFWNGADWMKQNAYFVEDMINWINANKCSEEEMVIVGASMGGQLCRYALSDMEQKNIPHCCKLYISFDSPNQGANIVLGAQDFIKTLSSLNAFAEDAYDRKIEREATTELLVYHTDPSPSRLHENRINWLSDLEDVGSYPQHLRKVAIANGSKTAVTQSFDAGDLLIDGDLFIDGFPLTTLFFTGDAMVWALPGSDITLFSDRKVMKIKLLLYGLIPVYIISTDPPSGTVYHYDSAPGCFNSALEDYYQYDDFFIWYFLTIRNLEDKFCFVPTVSSLDLYTDLYNNAEEFLIDNSEGTPFNDVFAPAANEYHVTINEANSDWTINQLNLMDYMLVSDLPDATLGETFNYGNIYRNKLHSIEINEGGLLQINGNYNTDYGDGDPAITGSTFTVRTNECPGAEININSDGIFEIGDDNTPTNNKGILELMSGSTLNVNAGGLLKIDKSGKIYIHDGATMVINEGGTVVVDDLGQIVIEDGGTLLMNDEALDLEGDNSFLDIQNGGIVITDDGVDFTFTGDGYINYNDGGIISLGEGSKFSLTGSSNEDEILRLNNYAALTVESHDVELTTGLVRYMSSSEFVSTKNTTTVSDVEFIDNDGTAVYALHCSQSNLVTIDDGYFEGFNDALKFNDIVSDGENCPGEVDINHCDFYFHRTAAIDADHVSVLHGYENGITAKNGTEDFGISAVTITDFTWKNSQVHGFSDHRGIFLEDVISFVMDGGSIYDNNYGIESFASNMYIRNKGTIRDNYDGIYSPDDPGFLKYLVIGDVGCGWIIDNEEYGVYGNNIYTDMDAVTHGGINRFDGNGTEAFHICIDADYADYFYYDDDLDKYIITARGNYWTDGNEPAEGVDYSVGINDVHCDNTVFDASEYVTTQPSDCDCLLPFPCDTEPDDNDLNARLKETSCENTIENEEEDTVMIARQFYDGWHAFLNGDYATAYLKLLTLQNKVDSVYGGSKWEGGPVCRHQYAMSKLLIHNVPAIAEAYCDVIELREENKSTVSNANQFLIYPNPANTNITFKCNTTMHANFRIYASTGNEIAEGAMETEITISMMDCVKGVYFILFCDDELHPIEGQTFILQ